MKTIVSSVVLSLAVGGAAFAETWVCDRTKLSTDGFSRASAAKSWYPEEVWFRIKGDSVDSYYGSGTIKPDGKRRLMNIKIPELPEVLITARLFDDGKATVLLHTGAGYVASTPSRYKCARRG